MRQRTLWALLQLFVAAALALVGWWAAGKYGDHWLSLLDDRGVVVERPELAWALLGIPALVLLRAFSLSDLPRLQQALSLALKSAFIGALTLSLMNLQERDERPMKTATVFVVDVSDSVPDGALALAGAVVSDALGRAAQSPGSTVRLVTFAGDAGEVPLALLGSYDDSHDHGQDAPAAIPLLRRPAGGSTDIQGALRLAFSMFSDRRLSRIVLVTDGLQTSGALEAELETARRFKIPIDYLDFTAVARPGELMVTALEAPNQIKANVPFAVTATLRSTSPGPVMARCVLTLDGAEEDARVVTAATGETPVRFELRVRARRSGGGAGARRDRRLAVICSPHGPQGSAEADRFTSNNRFERPVEVLDKPRLLYVEGERSLRRNLMAALDQDFDVEVRGARGLPRSQADAKAFDLIFISDVPRAADSGQTYMSTRQMKLLEGYARAGGGLIFAGGENAFGPGGYTGSYLERKVLPVRLEVQRKEDIPGVALMLVIDRSGSMSDHKIALAKQAALASLGALQPTDKLGIIAFDSQPNHLVKLQRASNRYKIREAVDRLRSGGGTNIFAAMDQAYAELSRVQAKIKHVILLTDGQSNRAGVRDLVAEGFLDKVTTSTVAVGMGADQELLRQMAEDGRGRSYATDSPQHIPKIFLKETSEITRKALVEDRFRPRVDPRFARLQMFKGINLKLLPSLIGYVSTRAKPRAEVLMTSHRGEPILARWRLGLGTVMVWTSDVKNKWATYWLSWSGYAKFWRQVIRDTMRVERDDPVFEMVADVHGGVLTIGVDAVDASDRFIDGVTSQVTVVGPDGVEQPVTLEHVAAGRYEGRLKLNEYGPYVVRGAYGVEGEPGARYRSFEAVAWPFPLEHLVGAADLTQVKRLAAATGGEDITGQPVARLFDAKGHTIETLKDTWPKPLPWALGFLMADLFLRRVRLYGRTRLGWL